jgi:hypothetical protein
VLAVGFQIFCVHSIANSDWGLFATVHLDGSCVQGAGIVLVQGDPEIQMYENQVMMGGQAKDILASEDWK